MLGCATNREVYKCNDWGPFVRLIHKSSKFEKPFVKWQGMNLEPRILVHPVLYKYRAVKATESEYFFTDANEE